jgi:hypothetical protein
MRPDESDQLRGAVHVLSDLISPLVHDPYAHDVLTSTIANLGMLAESLDTVAPFLVWDIEQATKVLELAGVHLTASDVPAFDVSALRQRHRDVRLRLEESIDIVRSHAEANIAAGAYFRERAARFPFAGHHRGGSLARAPR